MNVIKLFRFEEWIIVKLLFNFSFVLFVFYYNKPPVEFVIVTIALLCLYILSIGTFGYFINDWFDSKADLLSGKNNLTYNLALPLKIVLSFCMVTISIFPFLFVLPEVSGYFSLLAIQIALLILYSVPPIQLKHNIFGLLADSLFSFVLPALICMFIASRSCSSSAIEIHIIILLIVWLFLIGLRSIMIHQQKDFDNDMLSKNKTFTTQIGKSNAIIVSKLLLAIEIICFIVLTIALPDMFRVVFIISFTLFFVIEYLSNLKKILALNNFFNVVSKLNVFYNYYLFLGIALLMSINNSYLYLFFILVFIVVKWRDIFSLLKKFYSSIILYLYYKAKGLIRRIKHSFFAK